jgi:hypothetical protein
MERKYEECVEYRAEPIASFGLNLVVGFAVASGWLLSCGQPVRRSEPDTAVSS